MSNYTSKYRPVEFAEIYGQNKVLKRLRRFRDKATSKVFMFEGATGVGKTSAAIALAHELGVDVKNGEFGGLYVVSSGEQTADGVRALLEKFHYRPWTGSGWRVCVINEADKMTSQAELVWLDRLENLPKQTVIVFTTNRPEALADRFLDRCERLEFEGEFDALRESAIGLLKRIAKAEALPFKDDLLKTIVAKSKNEKSLSLRRCVTHLEQMAGLL